MNIDKLKKSGGSEWEKNGYHRVYFNDLDEWLGLSFSRYNTGNISSASLDGEPLSNSRAGEILSALDFGKLWFDVKDGQFHYKISNCRTFTAAEMANKIIANIKNKAEMGA